MLPQMSFNFNGFYQTWLMLDEKVKNDKKSPSIHETKAYRVRTEQFVQNAKICYVKRQNRLEALFKPVCFMVK